MAAAMRSGGQGSSTACPASRSTTRRSRKCSPRIAAGWSGSRTPAAPLPLGGTPTCPAARRTAMIPPTTRFRAPSKVLWTPWMLSRKFFPSSMCLDELFFPPSTSSLVLVFLLLLLLLFNFSFWFLLFFAGNLIFVLFIIFCQLICGFCEKIWSLESTFLEFHSS